LAGQSRPTEFGGVVNDEDAKADYSFIEYRLPLCQQRIDALEQSARELVRNSLVCRAAIAGKTPQTLGANSG